jgi:hypothetical protein
VICYLSSEEFFNGFIDGIRKKRMDEFKARYRSVDMLLLDDVQFFEEEQILGVLPRSTPVRSLAAGVLRRSSAEEPLQPRGPHS